MENFMSLLLSYYDKEITNKIINKYGYDEMTALRMFVSSQTYEMLVDEKLEMWGFSPIGIFDMWECEQATGNPRNSIYLMRDEYNNLLSE